MEPGIHIHLIGISGSGLSAVARVLLERGFKVSGSDRQLSSLTSSLKDMGAAIYSGHRADNIEGADLIVRSSAVSDTNVEVVAAREKGIPVLKRSEFLFNLMDGYLGIAVAGSHGKTTTTAMIAWMLSGMGFDPSFIIGGLSKNLGTNAHAGISRYFVIEADEYDRMFLGLRPDIAVITAVEHDHPDLFPTPLSYRQAFLDFTSKIVPGGYLLACTDDRGAAEILKEANPEGVQKASYGTGKSQYRAENLKVNDMGGYDFEVFFSPAELELDKAVLTPVSVSLQVPGEHNVRNALAALAVAHCLEIPLEIAARILRDFTGTGRRFEVLGEANEITIIDDYAHHPTEIRATLAAARARYPDREVWAVWQPHTYSRTRALFEDFASSFSLAHHVVATEVYPAREPVEPDYSSRVVVEAMNHPDAHFVADLQGVVHFLLSNLKQGDVMIVLSAGDASMIGPQILTALEERSDNDAGNQSQTEI